MKSLITVFFLFGTIHCFGQTKSSIIETYKDSALYKLVIRTEYLVDDNYVALDNFTARVTEDTVKIYYMRYGDGMVSSLMIPFSVFDKFIEFEQKIIEADNFKLDSPYSVKFEIGSLELRVPIDILIVDNLTNFMFSLEE